MLAMQVKPEHYQQQLFNIYPNDQSLKRQSFYRTHRAVHEPKCVVGERRYKGLAKKDKKKKGKGEHTQTQFSDNSPAFTCCTNNLKPLTKLTTHLQEAHDVGFIKVQHRKA